MDPLSVDPDNQYPIISYDVSPRESDSDNESIDDLILHPSTPVTRHYGRSRTHSNASGAS